MTQYHGYHTCNFEKGGEGWYACGGKLIPITWTNAGPYDPIEFFTEDGQHLEMERGNTFIAIAPYGSEIFWE